MNKKITLGLVGLLVSGNILAQDVKDTIPLTHFGWSIDLDEIQITSPKEMESLQSRPISSTKVGSRELESKHTTSLVDVAKMVPNFSMPDYGSRLTSAIYIRGVGSRINTPAVGLYVDDIPYVDKSAFNFNFYDIDRVEILRGPQGTLYGRNAMGGLVKVYSKDPSREVMPWEQWGRTDVKLGFATQDNHKSLSFTHYHALGEELAFSLGGYYEASDGFFRHSLTGDKVDDLQAGGGRFRGIYAPNGGLKFDLTVSYDYSDEGGYPYFLSTENGDLGSLNEYKDQITNNYENRYRRGLFNTGLNIDWKFSDILLHSATGFQNLDDRMFLDQDFTAADIYTIKQKQKLSVLSEELTLRNEHPAKYDWLFGVSAFNQWLNTNGPVTFYPDGVSSLIEDNVNNIFSTIKQKMPNMPDMGIDVKQDQFTVSSDMETPLLSAGLFHQSTLNLGRWSLVAGIRLDYEKLKLDYSSGCGLDYDFKISTYVQQMNRFIEKSDSLDVSPSFNGDMDRDYMQWLPKFTVKYSFNSLLDDLTLRNNFVYASVSKGYRSGGYNVQMFSDLVEGEMKNLMIDGINGASSGMMSRFVDVENIKTPIDINSVIYDPEYSWNYEFGTHIQKGDFTMQAAMFYIRTYDQQIARFTKSGFGRMMVNAGESESFGAELSAALRLNRFLFNGSYGYTHATFIDYDEGTNDYSGNYVPFVPMHTMNLSASYTFPYDRRNASRTVSIGADLTGQGRLYWTESNNYSQDFYAVLGAHASVRFNDLVSLNLWGRNLTSSEYNTFFFESASRLYEQHSKPFQIGCDIRLSF